MLTKEQGGSEAKTHTHTHTQEPTTCFLAFCRVQEIPGASVEHNKFCVSVHFRNCSPDSYDAVVAAVKDTLHDHSNLKASRGRKVLEIQPQVSAACCPKWHAHLWHLCRIYGRAWFKHCVNPFSVVAATSILHELPKLGGLPERR